MKLIKHVIKLSRLKNLLEVGLISLYPFDNALITKTRLRCSGFQNLGTSSIQQSNKASCCSGQFSVLSVVKDAFS
jgi:hypothetical protein